MKTHSVAILLLSVELMLSSCGGRGSSLPAGSHGVPQAKAQVMVRVVIPAATPAMTGKKKPMFVASTTQGIDVKVYASSDASHTNLLAESETDVSSGSTACGGTTGLPRTCNVPIPAPPGTDDFVVRSYDAPPVSGSFASATQIAAAIVPGQVIAPGSANAISITLGGVVASVFLSLPIPSIHGTVASSQQMAVWATDADGNVIVSDGYVDGSGNTVSIALAANPATKNGGNITFGSTSITAPSPSGIAVNYDGNATAAFSSTITATSSNGATAANATLSLLGPTITEYTMPGGAPWSITTGADGNLWVTENFPGQGKIAKIVPSTGAITEYTPPSSSQYSYFIVAGPDGNLWFTEYNVGNIAKVVPSTGAITEYATSATTSEPYFIVCGPDGNLWFTEAGANKIGKIVPSTGVITEYTPPSLNSGPHFIAIGADGNLWFTEQNLGNVAKLVPSTGAITEYATSATTSQPYFIVSGPNGNLWFTERAANQIAQIVPSSGAISEYAGSATTNLPGAIASGPDGNLWFTENPNSIAKVVPSTGVVTEYATPTTISTPVSIITGPDGNLWFAETNAGRVARLVPSSGSITEYATSSSSSEPTVIVTGPDGNLWFTEFSGSKVAKLTW